MFTDQNHDNRSQEVKSEQRAKAPALSATQAGNVELGFERLAVSPSLQEERRSFGRKSFDYHVLSGQKLDDRSLLERSADFKGAMEEYRDAVISQYFREHAPSPLGILIPLVSYAFGVVQFANVPAFIRFKNNERGVRGFSTQVHANETAFHYGARLPMQHFKEGNLAEALKCFRVALDAAPQRRKDIYEALGEFCMFFTHLQRDQRAGQGNPELYLEDQFDSFNHGWGLNQNPIYSSLFGADPGEMGGGDSWSVVSAAHWGYAQPVNFEKVRKMLASNTIPVADIGAEAFERAAEEPGEKFFRGGWTTYEERRENAQLQRWAGNAAWLRGDYGRAIELLTAGVKPVGSMFDSEASMIEAVEPLAWALRDAGLIDDAINVYAEALAAKVGNHVDFEHYHEFMKLCETKALLQGGGEQDKFKVALPYLRDLVEAEEVEYAAGREVELFLLLATAEELYGERDAAKAQLLIAHDVATLELSMFEEREGAYAERLTILRKEIESRLEKF